MQLYTKGSIPEATPEVPPRNSGHAPLWSALAQLSGRKGMRHPLLGNVVYSVCSYVRSPFPWQPTNGIARTCGKIKLEISKHRGRASLPLKNALVSLGMALDVQALRSHPNLVNHKLPVLLHPTRVANHLFSSIPMRYTCLYRKNTVFGTILGFMHPPGDLEIYPANMGARLLIWSLALPSQCFHAPCYGK